MALYQAFPSPEKAWLREANIQYSLAEYGGRVGQRFALCVLRFECLRFALCPCVSKQKRKAQNANRLKRETQNVRSANRKARNVALLGHRRPSPCVISARRRGSARLTRSRGNGFCKLILRFPSALPPAISLVVLHSRTSLHVWPILCPTTPSLKLC